MSTAAGSVCSETVKYACWKAVSCLCSSFEEASVLVQRHQTIKDGKSESCFIYFFIHDWCSQLANIQRLVLFIFDFTFLNLILNVIRFGFVVHRREQSVWNLSLSSDRAINMKVVWILFNNGFSYYFHVFPFSIFYHLSHSFPSHLSNTLLWVVFLCLTRSLVYLCVDICAFYLLFSLYPGRFS